MGFARAALLLFWLGVAVHSSAYAEEESRPISQMAPAARSTSNSAPDTGWKTFLRNSTLSLFTSFTGPSLGARSGGESYNVYASDRWPVQFYSALYYGYQFVPTWTAGVELSGIFNAVSGIQSNFGYTIDKSASLQHPTVILKKENAIDNSWLNLWLGLGLSIPTSKFALETQTQILSVTFDQTWKFKKIAAPWSFGFNTRLQPTIYQRAKGQQTFYFSIGHFLNYRITDQWELCTSMLFDFDRYGGDAFADLKPATDDRWKIEMYWYPPTSGVASIGLFLQGRVWQASPATTVVGSDITIRL